MTKLKTLAENYTHVVWNDKNLNCIEDAFVPAVVIHSSLGELIGVSAMREIVETWLTAFPDLHVVNNSSTVENHTVILQWQASGTHLGEFKGIKPTGYTVSYSGSTTYRFDGEKIVEYQAEVDMSALLNQLHAQLA